MDHLSPEQIAKLLRLADQMDDLFAMLEQQQILPSKQIDPIDRVEQL